MRLHPGLIVGALALASVFVSLPGSALAGLQKWSLVHLDANGGIPALVEHTDRP